MKRDIKKVKMNLGKRSYDITIGESILENTQSYMNLNRKVAIVTDSGVPREYSEAIASQCKKSVIISFPKGEESKNLDTYAYICQQMLTFGLQRRDAVVAVGGGVVGDMAGFAAATYMRGIDFYNVPTTLLSQVDSSIGGKTAIDFGGVKNILGAFYQPKAVLIDTAVLKTLEARQFSAGLAEVAKMALTSDAELFSMLEDSLWEKDIATLIERALIIKRDVVEEDERESGLRKILNFGHTFGHGIEALGNLYHGECVALGMLPMCSPTVRKRLSFLLSKMGLPTEIPSNYKDGFEFMRHDKKGDGDTVDAVFVDEVGSFRLEKLSLEKLFSRIEKNIL